MMISQASMAVLMRVLLASTALAERPEGLTALFDSNAMDDRGVIVLPISARVTRGSRNALLVLQIVGMRSANRVGLLVELENRGDTPWTPRALVVLEIGGEDLAASVLAAGADSPRRQAQRLHRGGGVGDAGPGDVRAQAVRGRTEGRDARQRHVSALQGPLSHRNQVLSGVLLSQRTGHLPASRRADIGPVAPERGRHLPPEETW